MELSERVRSMGDDELERVIAKLETERGTWHDELERDGLVALLRLEQKRRDGTETHPTKHEDRDDRP